MKKSILMVLVVMVFAACGPDTLINETREIEKGEWAFSDTKQFSLLINDTLTPLDFSVLIRHGGNYPYQNLILYVKTYFPNNSFKVDTIDCPLADKSGRWYGSGLGDMLDNKVVFKRNVQMPLSGQYNFEIQHAMRSDVVHEIYDIGLHIESAVQ